MRSVRSNIYVSLLLFLYGTYFVSAQKSIPTLIISNMDGLEININELSKEKVIIMNFWATWCEPCIKELTALNENESLIEDELNASLVSVSIDDSRTMSRIKPMMHGNSWKFDVVTDSNQDIKRMFNIIDIPHTLLIYQNKIVYESTGYLIGDEQVLFEKIKALNNK